MYSLLRFHNKLDVMHISDLLTSSLVLLYSSSSSDQVSKPEIITTSETLISEYSDSEFRSLFRMQKPAVQLLVRLLGKSVQRRETPFSRGRHSVEPEKQVLILAYFMATQSTERQTADKFGVSESSVHRCVHRMIDILVDDYQSVFIRWPRGDYAKAVVAGYREKHGLDGVIGAIDACHIGIKCSRGKTSDYLNHKGFHSIILQAVCDHALTFTDVYVGWPGSVHDTQVFSNSLLYQNLQKSPERVCPGGSFLIGDVCYPLSSTMMTPIQSNEVLMPEQDYYNFCHNSTRMTIDRAFALLRGRFRRLQLLDIPCPARQTRVVVAACIMHNMCLLSETELEDFIEEGSQEDVNTFDIVLPTTVEADQKRNEVITSLSSQV